MKTCDPDSIDHARDETIAYIAKLEESQREPMARGVLSVALATLSHFMAKDEARAVLRSEAADFGLVDAAPRQRTIPSWQAIYDAGFVAAWAFGLGGGVCIGFMIARAMP